MRLLHRSREDVEPKPHEPDQSAEDGLVREEQELFGPPPVADRWTPGSLLAVLAGAALAVVGIVALTRTEVNSTWYEPVAQVGGIDHTAFLAVIEIGVGALLVVLAVAGLRALTALLGIAAATAAAVAAVDPSLVERELAIERSWAIALAAGAAVLTMLMMLPWPTRVERRRAPAVRRSGYGQAVHQH